MAAQPKVIQIGVPFTMLNGITYATPTRQCALAVATTNGNVQASMTNTTNNWMTITVSEGIAFTSLPFIKTTETSLQIIAKVQ